MILPQIETDRPIPSERTMRQVKHTQSRRRKEKSQPKSQTLAPDGTVSMIADDGGLIASAPLSESELLVHTQGRPAPEGNTLSHDDGTRRQVARDLLG